MSAVGSQENIIKSADQGDLAVCHLVLVDAEQLPGKQALIDPVIVIKARLCRPADMQCAGHMGLRPVEDLTGLLPVIHLLEGNILHRGTCDDHAVEVPVSDLIQGSIKLVQMAGGGVHRHMTLHIHKGHIDLQRCVGQCPQQLQLRILLDGHVV